jgi:hypothetical protein
MIADSKRRIATSRFIVSDFAGGGQTAPTSRQLASMAYFYEWPDAHPRAEAAGAHASPPGTVAFGRFRASDAAIGGVILALLLWHFAKLGPD